MDTSGVCMALMYDNELCSDIDDDFLDPDYHISDQGNNELGDILPYETDSDRDETNRQCLTPLPNQITVINESNDVEPLTVFSKKRKRNLSKWQRKVTKLKKAKGDEHISLRKKVVPSRVTGPDCLCSKKCFVNVSDEYNIALIYAFNNIGVKCKQ